MTLLNRRQALLKVATTFGLVTGGGCLTQQDPSSTPTGTEADSSTPIGSTEPAETESETRVPAEKIMLAFSSESSPDVLVHFSITSEETVVSEGEVQISQGDYTSVETGIDTTGQYELSIEGDGGFESTHQFQIDEYDLRTGSNLIVAVYDDDTELMMEE